MSLLFKTTSKIAKGLIKNGTTRWTDVLNHARFYASSTSQFVSRSHTCGELRAEHTGRQVELYGWLQYSRLGYFCTLRDAYGSVQITIPETKMQSFLKEASLESVLKVKGTVKPRPEGQVNQDMQTGEVEVQCEELEVLNMCVKELPFQVSEYFKVKESLRMEYRYLDLRNSLLQQNLRLRSLMICKMRDFLCNQHGFVDVETPTLFRKTPGGAREFVVATHHKGKYFTLPQSPQQFKQLLMVGGIDRYMQIARCYRDEGAKPDRQPEFTQLDLEMSFVTPDGVKDLIEQLLLHVWPSQLCGNLTSPFPRMTYHDAMMQYGSDKPDTRLPKLIEITGSVQRTEVTEIRSHLSHPQCHVMAATVKAQAKLTRKDLSHLRTFGEEISKKFNTWFRLVRKRDAKTWSGEYSQTFGVHDNITGSEEFDKAVNFQFGDVLILASGLNYDASETVSKVRAETIRILQSKEDSPVPPSEGFHFLWVEDFPLFLPREDGTEGVESAHHPFTAPKPDDLDLVYADPLKVTSQHYDLVLNGCEVGGGSIRIHDSKLQRYVLTQVLQEDTRDLEHLLKALDFGCPPHGGIALGLDRLFAMLCGTPSIRDVIAFPKSSEGFDPMSHAPADLDQSTKDYYHLS